MPRLGLGNAELVGSKLKIGKRFPGPNFRTRAEQSLEATRVRERGMRKFKSTMQAQKFVTVHVAVHNLFNLFNLFNLGRHLVSANHYRNLRIGAFTEWGRAVA
jgi:putative transposase